MTGIDQLLSSFDQSWTEFSGAWKKARSKASEKSIHDLRVSVRRLIATLELTWSLSRYDQISKLQRRFKKVLKRMGPLRDIQVQLENVSHMRQAGPIQDFKETLECREEREIEDVRKELKVGRKGRLSDRVKDIRGEFERLSHIRNDETVRRSIERAIRLRLDEFLKCRRRFNPADEETLHEMRIALKELRYAVEAAQPVLGDSARDREREMHAFQQLMGDTRDIELLRAELEKWAAKKGKKLAIVPALDRLEQKRERLLKKIVQSPVVFAGISQAENHKPATEKTVVIGESVETRKTPLLTEVTAGFIPKLCPPIECSAQKGEFRLAHLLVLEGQVRPSDFHMTGHPLFKAPVVSCTFIGVRESSIQFYRPGCVRKFDRWSYRAADTVESLAFFCHRRIGFKRCPYLA